MRMVVISGFDPWRSPLCTCPSKLTLNPYTGCDHHCVYCYASSYIPRFGQCRPKKNLISRLKTEAPRLKGQLISMSNSSDPYPNQEAQTGLIRKCLQILADSNCKIQVITKSALVTRDTDLLKQTPSMVVLTITSLDDSAAELIEPDAPPPSERLKAAETLTRNGIPTAIRIDPIIPYVNDKPETLIKTLASIGIRHVTTSTLKIKSDNWKRLAQVLPETARKLEPLYFEQGERIGGNLYLPREMRLALMLDAEELAKKYGMRFGTCREGFSHLNTATCDGSWLLDEIG